MEPLAYLPRTFRETVKGITFVNTVKREVYSRIEDQEAGLGRAVRICIRHLVKAVSITKSPSVEG